VSADGWVGVGVRGRVWGGECVCGRKGGDVRGGEGRCGLVCGVGGGVWGWLGVLV